MFLIILYAAVVGVAICRPQTFTYLNITTPLEILDDLSDEERETFSLFMKIISDTATKKDQRLEKVRMMLANDSAEEAKELLETLGLAIEFNDWSVDQAKNASPKVRDAILKFDDLIDDLSFIKKTPAERETKIKAIFNSLSDSEKKELEQIYVAGEKKAKELVFKLPSLTMKKQH